MNFRKLFLPPLFTVALLLLLCGCIVWWESIGETRIIGGEPDNASRNAALIMAMFSPFLYTILFFLNLIDAGWDHFGTERAWLGTGGLILVSGVLLGLRLHAPQVDSSPVFAIAMGLTAALAVFVPMALIRRHALENPPSA